MKNFRGDASDCPVIGSQDPQLYCTLSGHTIEGSWQGGSIGHISHKDALTGVLRMQINAYKSIPDCENNVIQCFLIHPWCSIGSVLVHLNLASLPLKRPRTQAHLLQPRRSRAWPGAEQVNGALWLHWQVWMRKLGGKTSTKLISLHRDMERMTESIDIELLPILLQTSSICRWRTSHQDQDLCNANSNGQCLCEVPYECPYRTGLIALEWREVERRIDSLNKYLAW